MIAGLHWTAWLLLVVAIGLGLTIELRFYLSNRAAHRRSQRQPHGSGSSTETEPDSWTEPDTETATETPTETATDTDTEGGA